MSEKQFAKIVKEMRLQLGLTQVELAKTLHASQASVALWESARRVPPEFTRRLILAELEKLKTEKKDKK